MTRRAAFVIADNAGQSARDASDSASRPGITASFNNVPLNAQPLTQEGFRRALASLPDVPLDIPAELPRFTADELDDVDHTAMTKLDQATLRRGRLPTVEQIAKYREVRAKRLGDSTIASALKESRIDCEVAQHVLERWASGLGHTEVQDLCKETQHLSTRSAVDKKVESILNRFTFDTAELSDAASLRKRQEADERKQRLAQVQAQIATERAQRQHHSNEEPNFFNLIEID